MSTADQPPHPLRPQQRQRHRHLAAHAVADDVGARQSPARSSSRATIVGHRRIGHLGRPWRLRHGCAGRPARRAACAPAACRCPASCGWRPSRPCRISSGGPVSLSSRMARGAGVTAKSALMRRYRSALSCLVPFGAELCAPATVGRARSTYRDGSPLANRSTCCIVAMPVGLLDDLRQSKSRDGSDVVSVRQADGCLILLYPCMKLVIGRRVEGQASLLVETLEEIGREIVQWRWRSPKTFLSALSSGLAATVPGEVVDDLLQAGLRRVRIVLSEEDDRLCAAASASSEYRRTRLRCCR